MYNEKISTQSYRVHRGKKEFELNKKVLEKDYEIIFF
jgi:hypothetical protein